jgi:hypothetical protein
MWAAGLAVVAFLGCSDKTQQQVEDTSKAVVTNVKESAQEAVQVTKDAAAGAEVTAGVKSALLASDKMDTSAVNVDTVDGTVHLRGYVPSVDQKALAEEIARNTVAAGTSVVNELAVGVPALPVVSSGTPSPGASPDAVVDPAHDNHDGHSHEGDSHEGHSHEGDGKKP